jgi:hypothetical protein
MKESVCSTGGIIMSGKPKYSREKPIPWPLYPSNI